MVTQPEVKWRHGIFAQLWFAIEEGKATTKHDDERDQGYVGRNRKGQSI